MDLKSTVICILCDIVICGPGLYNQGISVIFIASACKSNFDIMRKVNLNVCKGFTTNVNYGFGIYVFIENYS